MPLLLTIAALYIATRVKREREERRADLKLRIMARIVEADSIVWARRAA
jgi:hypothetical protein